MSSSIHRMMLDGISKEQVPVLIGKRGMNMKKCIRNMYSKGCENPNFKFVEEEDSGKVVATIEYTSETELETIKAEIQEYIDYFLKNPVEFSSGKQHKPTDKPNGKNGHSNSGKHRSYPLINNLIIDIRRDQVSSFIGSNGDNIKNLNKQVEEHTTIDKFQIHLKYEDDLVYLQITLYHPNAFMRDYIVVENVINKFIDLFKMKNDDKDCENQPSTPEA